MCRWIGYFGNPIPIAELLYDAPHSLIEQSRDARLQASLSNLDGFGLGWRQAGSRPPVRTSPSAVSGRSGLIGASLALSPPA
jgi:glutamine amidotransferase